MLDDAIRAQTPPELQYLADDGFNRIVLYDNKAVSATFAENTRRKIQDHPRSNGHGGLGT